MEFLRPRTNFGARRPGRLFSVLWLLMASTPSRLASLSLAASRFAVTDLRLVHDTNDQQTLAQCEAQDNSTSWTIAGVSWRKTTTSLWTRLCVERQPIDQLVHKDPTTPVLTRIVLRAKATNCPKLMTLVGRVPTSTVAALCVQTVPAADALLKQNYISDITVTNAREYNNQFSGWTTLPGNADSGAFISFQRQVLPIVELRFVDHVESADSLHACESLESHQSSFWEQAGDGYINQAHSTYHKVLCIKRDVNAPASNQEILTDLTITSSPNGECNSQASFCLWLNSSVNVIGRFANATAKTDQRFVGDVALVRTKDKTCSHDCLMPGSWSRFSSYLNVESHEGGVFLFYRHAGEFKFSPPAPFEKPPLVARCNGTSLQFKVLQFADLHFTGDPEYRCDEHLRNRWWRWDCKESLTSEFMNDVLDLEKPDMVVFTGDNVQTLSAEKHQVAMEYATSPLERRGIPWAMVFGNHDEASGFTREKMYNLTSSMNHSYIQHGPPEVDGVGNYELSVLGPQSRSVLRMYFLDSHGDVDKKAHPDTTSRYEWVKQNQIDYYRALSTSHRERDDQVPSLMFFHIPLPEFASVSDQAIHGERNEKPSGPSVNSNLFSTLVEQDEVKAVFVGHDHVNEYCFKRQGIHLCYGGGTGFGRSYASNSFSRRVRVIEWSQDQITGNRTIRSWKRHFDSIKEIKNLETLYPESQESWESMPINPENDMVVIVGCFCAITCAALWFFGGRMRTRYLWTIAQSGAKYTRLKDSEW